MQRADISLSKGEPPSRIGGLLDVVANSISEGIWNSLQEGKSLRRSSFVQFLKE